MSKIPKEIVDKIEQRNRLNEEIKAWCNENLDMDGMDSDSADITDHYVGEVNSFENAEGREWCDQYQVGEDSFYGDYYWETEYLGKYLHMGFWI